MEKNENKDYKTEVYKSKINNVYEKKTFQSQQFDFHYLKIIKNNK